MSEIPLVADLLAAEVVDAVQHASTNTERSAQQQDFRLGMSDLGHCREYARRMIVQEPFTDVRDKTAAFLGTIFGAGLEDALKFRHPGWIFQAETVTTLPSGIQILGHPDVIIPDWTLDDFAEPVDLVVDLKSKDGLEVIKKAGPTLQQTFQKHGYAAGAIEAGLVQEDGLLVANVFFDRSGGDPIPHVVVEPYEPQVLQQIDMWLEDVFYAVRHREEASRDKPREWCASWCEYFTGCRGLDTDVTGLIEDPDSLTAIEVYQEGATLESRGKKMKEEARKALQGVSGSTGTHMLRWVDVMETEVPGYTRTGHRKISLTKIPGPKAGKK